MLHRQFSKTTATALTAIGFAMTILLVTTAHASPNSRWICQQQEHGALVLDGAKVLTVSPDNAGYTISLMQKDQFIGNQNLFSAQGVAKKDCGGFTRCELYKTFSNNSTGLAFFVNDLGSGQGSGQLKFRSAKGISTFDFFCRRN